MLYLPRGTQISQPQGVARVSACYAASTRLLVVGGQLATVAGPPGGSVGAITSSASKYGPSRSFNGSESASWPINLSGISTATVVLAFNRRNIGGVRQFWEYGSDGIANNGEFTAYAETDTTLQIGGRANDTGLHVDKYTIAYGPQIWVAQYDFGSTDPAQRIKFWVNGARQNRTQYIEVSSASGFSGPKTLYLGSRTNSNFFLGADVALFGLLVGRRTDNELNRLSQNPWQLFETPRGRSFVPVSVASGGGATHTNTGSLSADVATIAGTAVHKTLHATSGALASDAAVIAGIASSVTNRPSSGALASGSSTIAGTAAHKALHATSGALAAGASSIAGVSAHNIPHATSGALSSGAATIAGSAAKTSAGSFASSGSLSASDSAISGTATHKALHATSGALSAAAATLSGAARIASHRTEGAIAAGPAIMAGVAVHSGAGAVVETQYSGGYVETLREKDARRKRQKRLSDEADNRRQEEQQKPVEPQEKPKKARRIEVDRRPEQQVSLRDQIAALPVDLDAIYAVQERERLAAEQAAIEAELLAAEQEQQEIMWIASQVQQMIYDAYQGSDRWKAISGKLMRLSQILARR